MTETKVARGVAGEHQASQIELLCTAAATLTVARCGLRRLYACKSDVLTDWLLPIDTALRQVSASLDALLDGDLDAVQQSDRPYI